MVPVSKKRGGARGQWARVGQSRALVMGGGGDATRS
jgi:hypothetical protein